VADEEMELAARQLLKFMEFIVVLNSMAIIQKRLGFRCGCVLLATGMFGIVCDHARAATIYANSPSRTDVGFISYPN
jgi:hypothetical protein